MKKIKQILAIAGALLLVGLYLATLVLAITDNSATMNVFFASIVATVIIPVLIWAYTMIYRLVNKTNDREDAPTGKND
jgi:heme/copper-type cytochrome/quinol oxidase subunit 2